MKISVVIPTYNSAKTIASTLDSVLSQRRPADEILIMDDGSKDNTLALLDKYQPRIKVLRQPNQGVARARNELCRHATGDLVAFLDHDDLWHPDYLSVQADLFARHGDASGFFTGHVDFHGYGPHNWEATPAHSGASPEVIAPLAFVNRYHHSTGEFASMSYCCIPKRILSRLGDEPFCVRAGGVDDWCIFNLLPLHGSIVYTKTALAAYRVTREAQSADRLKVAEVGQYALEYIEQHCAGLRDRPLAKALNEVLASKWRQGGKLLMGAKDPVAARTRLLKAIKCSPSPASLGKSVGLWVTTYLPPQLQPTWPGAGREVGPT